MCARNATNRSFVILLTALTVAAAAESKQPTEVNLDASPAGTVPVGVAKIDITPDDPVRMYGYASRTTESEGVAQRLWAKALAIGGDEGDGPAVLLMVENGAVPAALTADLAARLKAKAGIRRERFMLCNTHIHSGPRPGKFPPPADLESLAAEERHTARYIGQLSRRLEQVTLNALASRKPGRLAWARGTVAFAGNRRTLKDGKWVGFGKYPDGPVDHSLLMLQATDSQGKLVAVLVNYACHCTTLRADFKQIHADWAGCAQELIEADHPGAVAMVCIGCGADADPYPHGTVKLAEQHGRAVANEARRLLRGQLTPIEPKLTARLACIELPFEKPPTREGARQQAGDPTSKQPRTPRNYPVATWVFGDDLAMVFLAGEVVVDYALRLKREIDGARLWITAYTNEVPCYIVSKRLLSEGGYEVRNSMSSKISYGNPKQVAPAIEDRIIGTVQTLLPRSFRSPANESAYAPANCVRFPCKIVPFSRPRS